LKKSSIGISTDYQIAPMHCWCFSRRIILVKDNANSELLALTADIVAAHVSNNSVAVGDLPRMIAEVYSTLASVEAPAAEEEEELVPAVAIRSSVKPDYIVCLEDGKKLKMLKRHLKTAYNMTPEEYRQRWGLASDYPMVAPNYAAQRSKLAKEIGLGTRRSSD
jgi:predicted transcriptional regulator